MLLIDCFDIWQAFPQHNCGSTYKILKESINYIISYNDSKSTRLSPWIKDYYWHPSCCMALCYGPWPRFGRVNWWEGNYPFKVETILARKNQTTFSIYWNKMINFRLWFHCILVMWLQRPFHLPWSLIIIHLSVSNINNSLGDPCYMSNL